MATGNKATEQKTSTAVALVMPESKDIAKGSGLKVLDAFYGTFDTEAKITELQGQVIATKREAQSIATLTLINAIKSDKRYYGVFKAAWEGDRKLQGKANDMAKALLDMGTFKKDEKSGELDFVESKPVQDRFGRNLKKDDPAWKRGDSIAKNFGTTLKTAMQDAVGAIDLKLDVSLNSESKALQISGPSVKDIWTVDSVTLDNSKQNLPDTKPDGKKLPPTTLGTIREIAAAKHGKASPVKKPVTTHQGATVPGGDLQLATRTACAELITQINRCEGKFDPDTVASLRSVVSVIGQYMPVLNPPVRASDAARKASEAIAQQAVVKNGNKGKAARA